MPLIFPHMVRHGDQQHVTDEYVSVPPALTITDEAGSVWTLGFKLGAAAPRGEFAFNVLRDGVETGEMASRIERRGGRVRIFTARGWKYLFTSKPDSSFIYAVGARVQQPVVQQAISVQVYYEGVEWPVSVFTFSPQTGGVHDLTSAPLVCAPGRWFIAVVRPVEMEWVTQVVAYMGGKLLREIPVSQHVSLKEQSHE